MFKKLKSLFVIEEGTPTEEQKSTSHGSVEGSKKETSPTKTYAPVTIDPNSKGQVQNKFLEVLFGALESNNQEGFDYLEFKDFLRSLANVPMEDSIRFKSAFATAQTMGATKEKILSSARVYMELLSKEETKFHEALNSQRDKNLTSKQNEIKKLEQTITDKQAEIEKLKKDIEDHRKQIGTMESDINAASDKLGQTASDFAATYQALLSQIQNDVKNIESHL
ncbi:MAG TPA: hypothetical protein VMZ69_07360 [Saprospiraceae bacterium]|nr:hypothetical protein [Saprospiraceae bacterium]